MVFYEARDSSGFQMNSSFVLGQPLSPFLWLQISFHLELWMKGSRALGWPLGGKQKWHRWPRGTVKEDGEMTWSTYVSFEHLSTVKSATLCLCLQASTWKARRSEGSTGFYCLLVFKCDLNVHDSGTECFAATFETVETPLTQFIYGFKHA